MRAERLRVGVITAPHGIRGEVKVYPTTDAPERYRIWKNVYLCSPDSDGETLQRKKDMEKTVRIESVKYFKNTVILKLSGIENPEEAKIYSKWELYVDRKDATPLKENENYIADLIGLRVITDQGEDFGKVFDIFPTGANHVLDVETAEGKHVLFPYIKDCILDVCLEEGTMLVHIMEGLLDV